jgi:micrococcal nuclease
VRALVVATLAAAALAGACAAGANTADAPPGAATVVEIIDGDTLVARIGHAEEHVRLIGIDTPELHKPNAPVECYGQEASDHLAVLLPVGTAITLVRDAEARDRYGRLLAYVYRASDDLFVNLDLAADGYAAALTIEPNVAHEADIAAAVDAARAAGLGLWGACGGPDTPVGG